MHNYILYIPITNIMHTLLPLPRSDRLTPQPGRQTQTVLGHTQNRPLEGGMSRRGKHLKVGK